MVLAGKSSFPSGAEASASQTCAALRDGATWMSSSDHSHCVGPVFPLPFLPVSAPIKNKAAPKELRTVLGMQEDYHPAVLRGVPQGHLHSTSLRPLITLYFLVIKMSLEHYNDLFNITLRQCKWRFNSLIREAFFALEK